MDKNLKLFLLVIVSLAVTFGACVCVLHYQRSDAKVTTVSLGNEVATVTYYPHSDGFVCIAFENHHVNATPGPDGHYHFSSFVMNRARDKQSSTIWALQRSTPYVAHGAPLTTAEINNAVNTATKILKQWEAESSSWRTSKTKVI